MAITVKQLTAFVAVVRSGSVTAAADELEVTQPSVSCAVASLSRELGCELLERDGRGVQPTRAGREFAGYASDVIGLLEAGQRAAREAVEGAPQHLLVAVTASAAETFAPALLQRYLKAHPEVTARLTCASTQAVLDAVIDRTADLAIVSHAVSDDRIELVPIRPNPLVCVASPSDMIATHGAVDVQLLEDRVWLMRETGSGTRAASEHYLAQRNLAPETLTLGSNAAIKQAVLVGLGVALLSREIVEADLRAGALVEIELTDAPQPQQWCIAHTATGPAPAAVVSMVEFSLADAAALDGTRPPAG